MRTPEQIEIDDNSPTVPMTPEVRRAVADQVLEEAEWSARRREADIRLARECRDAEKILNFGRPCGMSAKTLAKYALEYHGRPTGRLTPRAEVPEHRKSEVFDVLSRPAPIIDPHVWDNMERLAWAHVAETHTTGKRVVDP